MVRAGGGGYLMCVNCCKVQADMLMHALTLGETIKKNVLQSRKLQRLDQIMRRKEVHSSSLSGPES